MAKPVAKPEIYQIKVTLKGTKPPIWRRLETPAKTRLDDLHVILQVGMGWEFGHLHEFSVGRTHYGEPSEDDGWLFGPEVLNEKRYRLYQIAPAEGSKFNYAYDFGDSWEHAVLVEKILLPEPGVHYPRCIKGRRACPPEDVGGVWGYADFLNILKDPTHPDYESWLEWIGGEFDSEKFDLDAVNARFEQL